MGKDAINQLKGGAQGGVDDGGAMVDPNDNSPEAMKVKQNQKKTLQSQLAQKKKQSSQEIKQITQQIASIR